MANLPNEYFVDPQNDVPWIVGYQAKNLGDLMRIFTDRKTIKQVSKDPKNIISRTVEAVAQRLKTPAGVEELVQYLDKFYWMQEEVTDLFRQIPTKDEKEAVYNSLKERFKEEQLNAITAYCFYKNK
jgi:hypothetical protein